MSKASFVLESGSSPYIVAVVNLPRDPVVTLLNIWPCLKPNPFKRELIELMLCAARSLIAQHWKSLKIPDLRDWWLKVWDFFLQDKVSTDLLRADNYPVPKNLQEKWLPILTAVSSKVIDVSLFSNHIHYDLLCGRLNYVFF